MKRECFEKENKFIESDMPGDIYLAIRVKTFVTFNQGKFKEEACTQVCDHCSVKCKGHTDNKRP